MTVLGLRKHCWLLILSCPNSYLLLFSDLYINCHKPSRDTLRQSLPITACATPPLPNQVFPTVKTGSTSTAERRWRLLYKERDWYPKTLVLTLLYPTPKRLHIFELLVIPQLSTHSRELKCSEPGLCYVFVECPTPWWPGPVRNWVTEWLCGV